MTSTIAEGRKAKGARRAFRFLSARLFLALLGLHLCLIRMAPAAIVGAMRPELRSQAS